MAPAVGRLFPAEPFRVNRRLVLCQAGRYGNG
jgi:hypothetical protein